MDNGNTPYGFDIDGTVNVGFLGAGRGIKENLKSSFDKKLEELDENQKGFDAESEYEKSIMRKFKESDIMRGLDIQSEFNRMREEKEGGSDE